VKTSTQITVLFFFNVIFLCAYAQEKDTKAKHELGFHIGTNLDIPFVIYDHSRIASNPFRYYPTFDIEAGIIFKSKVAKRLKVNYGFSFRYYSYIEKYNGYYVINNNVDPVFTSVKPEVKGIGAFNFPIRLNVYGKKMSRYFLVGVDFSIPFFSYSSLNIAYGYKNVYVITPKDLKYIINAPVIIGMGFDIQKRKMNLSIEPNMQLWNVIGYYPPGSYARKFMFSLGVNVIGLKQIVPR
jgi:hypothetical protein